MKSKFGSFLPRQFLSFRYKMRTLLLEILAEELLFTNICYMQFSFFPKILANFNSGEWLLGEGKIDPTSIRP